MASESTHAPEGASVDNIVTPFKVQGKQDYTRLIREFGTQPIDKTLLERFERATGVKPHPLLRRGLFFSHRDFDRILSYHEKGEPFFLYTGRGPSTGSMHLGHSIPFEFTKFLQDAFDVPLVIMLTDDEKFLYNAKLKINELKKMAIENAKDIMSFGFDPKKTFIYSDFKTISGHMYENACEFSKLITFNQVRGAFGFDNSTNIGFINFPAIQNAAAFASSYPIGFGDDPDGDRNPKTSQIPCFIPCAIDQDPYFRLVRDNVHRMDNPPPKPALIHAKFVTALQGAEGKMSASDPTSAIFMSDTAKQIKDKINKHAFSGGQETLDEHRKKGGDPDIDVAYSYLSYFLDDDEELAQLAIDYRKGELLTGEMKKRCIGILQDYVGRFQERRAAVTEDVVKSFMVPHKFVFNGNPTPGVSHPLSSEQQKQQTNGANEEQQYEQGKSDAGESEDESTGLKPQRPGLGRKTTYGIRGLSSYGGQVTEMLYPTKSREVA